MNLPLHRRSLSAIVAASIVVLSPAAIAMTYDDFGDLFKNAVNGLGGDRPPTTQFPDVPMNQALQSGATQYSSFGAITDSEVNAMNHLRFPQSFHAMRRRFGAPAYTQGNSEWFERSNGQFIVVNYDGDRAVSMEARN
ncbi:hypothetical protein C7B65_15135 [Phormidesmis priestleyi ULC007]|uniref:Uncharacterized protein n=1 Tax=Phormidesmis priestleyi ULC007 TaxID=1920490 RepID=A0A2T1DD82_9CYAN|nr:hypothetical protein [Phormidesmis priestleyi]PSB18426.1 hypothetical protein C7B65_15135 [Phormidesmis priestleyi ULC007]PZO48847.1 MAG: hypothetical protein DCF14_16055 [Phormidesmis priestleyi]